MTPCTVDPAGNLVGQGAGHSAGHAPTIGAAAGDRGLGMGAELVFRTLGDDIDDPGGGVRAEQRALRAAQHFDALEFAEIAEADTVAGARHTVDHDTDRGFKAGVVANRTDAADAGRGLEFVRGRGDVEGPAR